MGLFSFLWGHKQAVQVTCFTGYLNWCTVGFEWNTQPVFVCSLYWATTVFCVDFFSLYVRVTDKNTKCLTIYTENYQIILDMKLVNINTCKYCHKFFNKRATTVHILISIIYLTFFYSYFFFSISPLIQWIVY